MTVSGAEMLEAASFSRRAGIPPSPVPFDVLSSLSWRWTNAADTGFKENKDWLELFKHASVLGWFQLRGGILESNFSTTFVKYVQKLFAIVRASVVVFPSTVIGSMEFYNFYSVNFFFASPRIQTYMEKTFSVLCVEIMETYFSGIVKSPGKNCALLGHLPFKPKFCNFQSVHQMEWTISVWSNWNIQDQLWRWSTLTVWGRLLKAWLALTVG